MSMTPRNISVLPSTTLLQQAHDLGIDIASVAQKGVAAAVRAAKSKTDRDAYTRQTEHPTCSGMTCVHGRTTDRGLHVSVTGAR